VVLVLACGTALAASQLFGVPVRSGLVLSGTPKAGQVLLAPLRVSDPAGGLPWGVRIYTTRRDVRGVRDGLSCVQVGRVLDGQLGVIGEDGAFGDDGLFHALPVEPEAGCAHAQTASLSFGYVPQSAFAGSRSCVAPAGGGFSTDRSRRVVAGSRACPIGDLRLVVYGVASRRATSARLASSSGVESERLVAGDDGAFLFVLAAAGLDVSRAHLRVTFGH
jgi:hypothetical protein